MELRRYWEIILRRKWTAIGSFFIILITAVIGANIATPIYEGKAKILIESSNALSSLMSSLNLQSQGGQAGSQGSTETYDTEIALLQIRPVLENLINNLNLKNRKGEQLKVDEINFSIVDLIFPQPYIDVEQYEDSDLLEITGGSTNSVESAKIANELARLYIADTIDRTKTNYKAARLFIESKIRNVKEEYYRTLLEKKDFMIKETTVNLQEEIKRLLDYIADLKNDYKNNEVAIGQANESIKLIEEKLVGKEHASSNIINSLQSKLNDLLVDISGKKIRLTEEHPDILELNKEIETIKELLREKMEVVFSDKEISFAAIYEELIRNLKDAYINRAIGEIKREVLKQYIAKSQDELMKIPSKFIKQSEIDLSLSVNQEIYKNLLEYLNQVGIAESMTLSNIRLVEPAVEPASDRPYFPKKVLSYVLGIFVGLFWGLFLTFFIEYIDQTIKAPEDLKNYGLTFLGSIPKFRGKFKEKPLISKLDSNDPIYESYRKALSSMHFARIDKPYKKVLVSAINPKEGSSTTAANLGIMLAKEGKRVLLIDADLRRPNLNRLFGLPHAKGLTDLLLENAEMEKVIYESGVEGLKVLTTGEMPADTGLLLKSSKFQNSIRELEKRFDLVIVHSAPLLIKDDAFLLMSNIEEMIIVLKNGSTTHNAIARVGTLLKNGNITPIGVILNCV